MIMRAFLIDPFERTVTEVDYDGDYRSIYKLCDFGTFDVVNAYPYPQADVFVDDEGLFKEGQSFFLWGDYPQPLAGKGLILGHTLDGESEAVDLSYEQIKSCIHFVMPMRMHGTNILAEFPFAEDDEVEVESEGGDAG